MTGDRTLRLDYDDEDYKDEDDEDFDEEDEEEEPRGEEDEEEAEPARRPPAHARFKRSGGPPPIDLPSRPSRPRTPVQA